MNSSPSSIPKKSPVVLLRQILPDLIILPSVALLLSGVMTWANVGFGEEFYPKWIRGFITSLVVLPVVLVCLGTLERLVDRVLMSSHWVTRKIALSLLTTGAIETVLALAVTLINNPLDHSFAASWWISFTRALPAGVMIGLFMCFYMKPRMDRMRAAAVR
jgi:hypothetical protein